MIILKKELRAIHDEDKLYIEDKFKEIIDFKKNLEKDCIVDHNFKGSKKDQKYQILITVLWQFLLGRIPLVLLLLLWLHLRKSKEIGWRIHWRTISY
jgi:hypothetical protein